MCEKRSNDKICSINENTKQINKLERIYFSALFHRGHTLNDNFPLSSL